jgi:hypothetical protein
MQGIIDEEVDKMLAEGVIEPSDSPWSSPIVLAKKKDGKHRFCIDFRKVNEVTRKDAYPLPFINVILDKLRRARYISTIDLKSGYWQVPLTPSSKPITAFTVPSRGLYQFRVMPFGLHSAPATFQRLMDRVIGPELDPYCFAYLDDIVVLGETFEQHLQVLQEVFRRLRAANLRLNPDKCQFGRRSLTYLGHVVTAAGIRTDPDKVAAIRQLATPKTLRQLRFSRIAAPLNRLLKKGGRWDWTPEQDAAFNTLKDSLSAAPVLACPDFGKPFVLQTDAADTGLGVALTQYVDGGDHVIAYASRSLTKPEQAYSTTEKECLAVVWGIEKMRPYLEGYRFTVLTDHQSLKWLQAIKDPTGRLARWAIFLQQHDFDIRYRKGVLNRVADTLSRQPAATEDETTPEDLFALEGAPGCNWYTKMRQEVEKKPAAYPDYSIQGDRLHRHSEDRTDSAEPELSDPWKLCVPKPARAAVLRECHNHPTAGHLGIGKTTACLALRYYWPGMSREAAQYVRNCPSCQRPKTPQQQPPGKTYPAPNRQRWESVSTDRVGPLPRSSRGNGDVAVIQDRSTKWVQGRTVRKATARTEARPPSSQPAAPALRLERPVPKPSKLRSPREGAPEPSTRNCDLASITVPARTPAPGPSNVEAKPYGCDPQAPRLPRPESLCWRCGVPGHSRGDCRAPMVLFCSRCGTLGLLSRECPCPRPPTAPLPRAADPPHRSTPESPELPATPERTPCPLCGRRRRHHRR